MTKIILAARGRITTHFGENIGRGFPHRGIDQGHGDGNAVDLEIRAPADGEITAVGGLGSYGQRLVILHDDGWVSLLAHHAAQFVRVGQRVRQGDVIARMGNTGTVYVHNHQELRDASGTQLDPLLHLGTSASSASVSNSTPLPPKLYIPQGEEDMTAPIYAKGDKDATVYALYVNAGDANSANGFAGAVYSGRRKVSAGEFAIVEKLGFPHEKQKAIIEIPQKAFDAINKLAGSE